MLDPAIENFLSERLKKKSISNPSPSELLTELYDWLPNAVKKAEKLFSVTHPVKFSHPDTKNTSEIRATSECKADGFLRTGNAITEFDTIFDTSANIPIAKFLSLKLADKKSVLEHLQQNSELIKLQLTIPAMSFAEVQKGLLAITNLSATAKTSEKIKQVYFPVDNDYHLLSLLTPSGLLFKLKEKVNRLRFSDAAKQARDDRRAEKHNEDGFSEIYNLAVIGFGGTKPQNISVLNNQNGGTAYLLSSLPPQLEQRDLRRPKKDFFKECLYYQDYQDSFKALQKVLKADGNIMEHREERDEIIISLVMQIMETVWQYRELESGWTEHSESLPLAEKIWLDNFYAEQRETEDNWLNDIIVSFRTWLRVTYEKKRKAIFFAEELLHVKGLLTQIEDDLR